MFHYSIYKKFVSILTAIPSFKSNLVVSTHLNYERFATSTIKNPTLPSDSIVNYLINSCGLSSLQANKASKHLAHVKSLSKPDLVLGYLRKRGFDNTQIKNIITLFPKLLCANVDKTLEPKLVVLHELGFTEPELVQLVSKNPAAFYYRDLVPKIEFWRSLLGTNEKLLKLFSRDTCILGTTVSTRVLPNMRLLEEMGFPNDSIVWMATRINWFISDTPESIKDAVKKVDELGISRKSRAFCSSLFVFRNSSQETLDSKFEFFKSFGWSDEDVLTVFRKIPFVFGLSKDNIRLKMEFFINEAMCSVSYLVRYPFLLSLSLERRLKPRYKVLSFLKSENFPGADVDQARNYIITDKVFMEKFVLPNKDKHPSLFEDCVKVFSSYVQS